MVSSAYPTIIISLCAIFLFYKYVLQVFSSIITNQLMHEFQLTGAGLGLGDRRNVMLFSTLISCAAITMALYFHPLPIGILSLLLFMFGFGLGAFMLVFAMGKELNHSALTGLSLPCSILVMRFWTRLRSHLLVNC